MRVVHIEPRSGRRTWLAVRVFLEAVFGALAIFLLAAALAPRLFDLHNNLALAAAVLIWIACPVLGFLLAVRVGRELRRLRGASGP